MTARLVMAFSVAAVYDRRFHNKAAGHRPPLQKNVNSFSFFRRLSICRPCAVVTSHLSLHDHDATKSRQSGAFQP